MTQFHISLGSGELKAGERGLIRAGGQGVNFHFLLNQTRCNQQFEQCIRQVKHGLKKR